jgi:hypothetical protein
MQSGLIPTYNSGMGEQVKEFEFQLGCFAIGFDLTQSDNNPVH